MLKESFNGYLTEFEIDFLTVYQPLAQMRDVEMNEEERYVYLRDLKNDIDYLFSDKTSSKTSSLKLSNKKYYKLSHLSKRLSAIEVFKTLNTELCDKLTAFNAIYLALNYD